MKDKVHIKLKNQFLVGRGPFGKLPGHKYLFLLKVKRKWGTWVARLVKCPTPDFGSGHDLTVHEIEPHIRLCADRVEPAQDSLSLSLSLSLSFSAPPPISQNK